MAFRIRRHRNAAALILAVESVDRTFERLSGQGVSFLNEPLPIEQWSPELRAGSGLDAQG